jgi:hypothetical protein
MWIMTNNSYLSIVSKDCGPAELLVRARRTGDIEKVFPNAKVTRQTDSDYLYQAVLPRDVVKQALAAMIDLIDYPNFKDSVEDRSLHAAYVSVWCACRATTSAARDRARDPCKVSTNFEKHTVAPRRRAWSAGEPTFRLALIFH